VYNDLVPAMKSRHIVGHEFMGEVVEVGSETRNMKVGECVAQGLHLWRWPRPLYLETVL
jgi:threonine dehydrogenase-like Zn-dependent dehydrogenase